MRKACLYKSKLNDKATRREKLIFTSFPVTYYVAQTWIQLRFIRFKSISLTLSVAKLYTYTYKHTFSIHYSSDVFSGKDSNQLMTQAKTIRF